MRIHITTTPRRAKPAAGDERLMKGAIHIRQQRRASCGAFIVNNGRPVWEWVIKGGEYDRSHHGAA